MTRAEEKTLKEAIREEWFSLHLMDNRHKTPTVRHRMRTLYQQFLEVR